MKKFTTPEMEVLKIEQVDILTTSGRDDLDWDIYDEE